MKTPVRVLSFAVAINFCLNITLVCPMKGAGIALATAITAALNLGALAFLAQRRWGVFNHRALINTTIRITAASIAAWAVAALLHDRIEWNDATLIGRALQVFIAGGAGMAAFTICAFTFGLKKPLVDLLPTRLKGKRS